MSVCAEDSHSPGHQDTPMFSPSGTQLLGPRYKTRELSNQAPPNYQKLESQIKPSLMHEILLFLFCLPCPGVQLGGSM